MTSFSNIIAIDYETANSMRDSVCAVAAIKYDLTNGRELARYCSLVNPQDEFDLFNIMIHGITPEMVTDSPLFPASMDQVFSMADDGTLFIAHNAAFDISVMRYAASKYQMDLPDIHFSCTFRLAKQLIPGLVSYTLPDVADYCSIAGLQDHMAESDTEVCGRIFLRLLQDYPSVEDMLVKANLEIGVIENGAYSGIHRIEHEHNPALKKTHVLPQYTKGEASPFFGKTVVFTGAMQSMTREEAEGVILDIGGSIASGVSKKVDFLVTGYQDPRKLNGKEKSSKVVAAEKLLAKGHRIEVVPEEDFLIML